MAQLKTLKVKLKGGATAVINAAEFDPALHTEVKAPSKAPRKKVKAGGRSK